MSGLSVGLDEQAARKAAKKLALQFAVNDLNALGKPTEYNKERVQDQLFKVNKLMVESHDDSGISEVTDLKRELECISKIQLDTKAFGYPQLPRINARGEEIRDRLKTKYGIETEERTEINASERQMLEDELKRLKLKKANGEAKGSPMPKTTARIEMINKLLNPQSSTTKETGTSMSQGKDVNAAVKVQNVEVVRHGDKLLIPQNLDINDAIKLLQDRARYEEETAKVYETYDVFPWDGAIALGRVLKSIFGWVPQQGTSVQVENGVNSKISVPWGEFVVPGIDGRMICQAPWKDGRVVFAVMAVVKHKHEHVIKDILEKVREELKVSSIYRGKAIKVRFLSEDGEKLPIPEPKFIDVLSIDENSVAYAKPVQDAIETNLFTPIRRVRELEANGLPIKRSVMLGGVYGTGKTLAAGVAAKLAVQVGMTYIYVSRADELTHALSFSRPYQDPAVMLFCEDLDRVMSGERSVAIDDILNTIDGVDTKNDRRMMVFTTNNIEAIEPAMIRPGRLDAVIEVTPPDAGAAWKLAQIYGKGSLSPEVDGNRVGLALADQIPAVIAEVVRRAKLSQLKLTPTGERVLGISTEALLDAAETMTRQLALLNRGVPVPTKLEEALSIVGDAFYGQSGNMGTLSKETLETVKQRAEAERTRAPLLKKAG